MVGYLTEVMQTADLPHISHDPSMPLHPILPSLSRVNYMFQVWLGISKLVNLEQPNDVSFPGPRLYYFLQIVSIF